MTQTVETKTVEGPVYLTFPNGDVMHMETTITSVHDFWETPFGPIDFGYAYFSPQRAVVTRQAAE